MVPTTRRSTALYRRRRLSVLAAMAAVLALVGAAKARGDEPTLETVAVSRVIYIVQPGDTLWTIARSLQPDGEVRPLVDRLAAQRSSGSPLLPGERLAVHIDR